MANIIYTFKFNTVISTWLVVCFPVLLGLIVRERDKPTVGLWLYVFVVVKLRQNGRSF